MQQTNFESQESYEAYIKYSLEQTQNIENEQYQDDDVENLAIQNKEMQKIQKENPISISTKSTEFSKEKSSDSFSEQNNNGYLSKTNSQNDQETKSKLQQENNYLYDGEISTFKLGPHLALHFNPENQTLTLSNQCIDQLGVQELGDQIEKHSKDLQILVLRLKQEQSFF